MREVLPIPDPSNLDLSTIIELTLFLILFFAVGLIFFKASPRGVSFKDASKWICKISDQAKIVGVFVNEEIGIVKAISNELGLDYVQLHGEESPKYCSQINKPVIKSHGSTDSLGFANSLKVCEKIIKGRLIDKIKENIN